MGERRVLRAVVVLLSALAIGSASRGTTGEPVADPFDAARTWQGKSLDQVVEALGRPSSREPDGEGGAVLTYDEIVRLVDPPALRRPLPVSTIHGSPPPTYEPVPSERMVSTRTDAVFWLDPKGRVYRYWFSPRMHRKGKVSAPPAED